MIENKRAVDVLIFNDAGELALQLRAAHDASFPSHWDFSAGGGIDEGEEPAASARREMKEELGVAAPVTFLGEELFTYPAWRPGVVREVDACIYKARHNGPFAPDANEVADVRFFKLAEIEWMIKSDEKLHPEFVLAWKKGIIAHAVSA